MQVDDSHPVVVSAYLVGQELAFLCSLCLGAHGSWTRRRDAARSCFNNVSPKKDHLFKPELLLSLSSPSTAPVVNIGSASCLVLE